MKRTRLMPAIIVLALVLTSVLLAFAACGENGFAVNAQFNSQQGTVSVSQPAEGSRFDSGEQATVTVTPNEGYEVASFTVSGYPDAALDANGQYKFNVTADTTVTVTFRGLFGITVNVLPNAKAAGFNLSTPQNGSAYYDGETAILTVTPAGNYAIVDVKVNGTAIQGENGEYEFVVSKPTTVDITLKQTRFTVTAGSCQNGTVTLSKPKSGAYYAENEVVTVTPNPQEDYKADKVFVGESEITPNSEGAYTFAVTADVTVTATFTKFAFTVSTNVTGADVTLSPAHSEGLADGKYTQGEQVTVTVTEDRYHFFKGAITLNGEPLEGTNGAYTFTVQGDCTLDVQTEDAGVIDISEDRSGGATWTLVPEKEKYELDETVTVTVAAKEGYEIKYVRLNGADVQNYEQFTVKFDEKINQEVTISLQSPADRIINNMKGSLRITGGDAANGVAIDNIYDVKNDELYLQATEHGVPYFVILAKRVDGVTNTIAHDPETGDTLMVARPGMSWSTYQNPFETFTYTNLQPTADGGWRLNTSAMTRLFTQLTHNSNETAAQNSVTIQDERITNITFQTITNKTYEFSVTEFGSADVPDSYFAASATTTELSEALAKAANAQSYKVEAVIGSRTYNTHYTPQVIYTDALATPGGYVMRTDGYVWTYSYENVLQVGQSIGLTEEDGGIAYFKTPFEPAGDINLFSSLGDGVYQVALYDLYLTNQPARLTINENAILLSSFLGICFGSDADLTSLMAYARTLKLTVTADALKVESLAVDPNGSLYNITLTFSGYNETDLPFDTSDQNFVGMPNAQLYMGEYGVWTTPKGDIVVEIGADGVTVNGQEATIVNSTQSGLTFTVDGTNYTVTAKTQNEQTVGLTINGGTAQNVEMTPCMWFPFVGEYDGYYIDEEYNIYPYYLIVTPTGIQIEGYGMTEPITVTEVMYAGYTYATSGGDTVYGYEVDFTFGGRNYILGTRMAYSHADINFNIIDFLDVTDMTESGAGYESVCTFYGDATDEYDLSGFVNVYTGGLLNANDAIRYHMTIEVRSNAVYVTFVDDENYANTELVPVVDFVYEQTDNGLNAQLGIVWDGELYYLILSDQIDGYEWLFCYVDDEGTWIAGAFNVYDGEPLFDEQYRGNWSDNNGDWVLTVEYNAIYLFYRYEATNITAIDGGYSFQVKVSDEATLNFNVKFDGDVLRATVSDGEETEEFVAYKCEWIDFIGEWQTGTDYGMLTDDATLTVTAQHVTLTTYDSEGNGTPHDATNISVGMQAMQDDDGNVYYFEVMYFTVDGVEYAVCMDVSSGIITPILYFYRQTESGETLALQGLLYDVTQQVALSWTAEQVAPATYSGVDESETEYTVQITADSVVVTIGEGEPQVFDNKGETPLVYVFVGYDYFYGGDQYLFALCDQEGNVVYLVQVGISGDYVLFSGADDESNAYILTKDGADPDWSDVTGTYKGTLTTESASTAYTVTVTAEGVTVTIGSGNAQEYTVEFYDALEGFSLSLTSEDGETEYFYLLFDADEFGNPIAYFTDGETFSLRLTKQS